VQEISDWLDNLGMSEAQPLTHLRANISDWGVLGHFG
jgi:hypothetical protein